MYRLGFITIRQKSVSELTSKRLSGVLLVSWTAVFQKRVLPRGMSRDRLYAVNIRYEIDDCLPNILASESATLYLSGNQSVAFVSHDFYFYLQTNAVTISYNTYQPSLPRLSQLIIYSNTHFMLYKQHS
jgi:hypothetical protein